jgi:hypothetical protein
MREITLSAEGKGLEYTKTLPISSRKIVVSKALISTAAFVFVPIAMVGISIFRPLTSISAILIPFLTIISVASASIFEIVLFLRTTGKGQMSAIANDVQKLFIGVLVVLVLVAYRALDRNNRSLEKLKRFSDKIQEILAEQQPYVFLYVPYSLPVVSSRIKGIVPAPAGITYNFKDWYVPKNMQKYSAVP